MTITAAPQVHTPRPMSLKRVRFLLALADQEPVSLEAPLGGEDGACLADLLEDASSPTPFDAVAGQLLKEHLTAVLDSLPGVERRVIALRFGLEDGRGRTLEEIGGEFGLTRERIRQIEARALRRLRTPSRRRVLEGYLD